MFLGSQQKQSSETKRVLVDYSVWLGDMERLSPGGGSATIQRADGTPVVLGMDLSAVGPVVVNERTGLAVFVSLGVDGRDYKLTIRAPTDQGQVREDEVIIQVREI